MELSGIFSISGKPGLYKYVAQTKNGIIVESLSDGKRMHANAHHRISALEDISIYTYSEDLALKEVLIMIASTNSYQSIDDKVISDSKALLAAFRDAVSEFDEDRVYACGYSEGGIFSYELGCRLNDRITSFVSVSGSMIVDSFREEYYGLGLCNPIHPTAVMLIPGTEDYSFHSTYDGFQPYYMSVNEITSYWASYNDTDVYPTIESVENFYPNDGSTVERKTWSNGENCVSVVELKVNGGGHDWPGTYGNMDISATEEIWNFVSNHGGLLRKEPLRRRSTVLPLLSELPRPQTDIKSFLPPKALRMFFSQEVLFRLI